MYLAPVSNANSLAFVERLSTFVWCLQTETGQESAPETAVLATVALRALRAARGRNVFALDA